MANIKISELNSLSKKAYNDVVPIVDVSANETKKVSIEELVDNNVSLIAVTDTAPSECEEGDKYYNTTTNLIYTAIEDDTWGETGETPKNGIMYIVYSKKSTYAYDGQELISVGGGSGAYIGTTQPPQDDNSNLWINPNESVNVYGNYISNSYGTSQEIGYSQEYVNGINGKVLWTNPNPSTTFSDNIISLATNDCDCFEVIYETATNEYNEVSNSGKIPFGKRTRLNDCFAWGDTIKIVQRVISSSSNTTLSLESGYAGPVGSVVIDNNACIPLYVIGYKTGLFS